MKSKSVTVSIPTPTRKDLTSIVSPIILFVSEQSARATNHVKKLQNSAITSTLQSFKSGRYGKLLKKNSPKIILGIFLIVLGFGITRSLQGFARAGGNTLGDSDRIKIQEAKSTQHVGYELSLPLRDDNGEELTTITYRIDTAELRDEIVVQGKRATSVEGRTFLVLNLKITNTYEKPLSITSRDYIRLSVNGNTEELLAADIHNDPVEVQPFSTKLTRIGFPINDTDTRLRLFVGELVGEKEELQLTIK